MIKLEITADSAADFKKTFEGLAAIITSAPAASAAPAEASKPAAEKPKAEVKPKAEEKAKPAAEKPKDKPKSEDEPKKVSLDDDLSPLITKLATAGHRDQLVDILGEYGVQRASQVPEEHWADLLEKLQEAVDSI
jgi:hypothetical protein